MADWIDANNLGGKACVLRDSPTWSQIRNRGLVDLKGVVRALHHIEINGAVVLWWTIDVTLSDKSHQFLTVPEECVVFPAPTPAAGYNPTPEDLPPGTMAYRPSPPPALPDKRGHFGNTPPWSKDYVDPAAAGGKAAGDDPLPAGGPSGEGGGGGPGGP